jgi:hypothetical protein
MAMNRDPAQLLVDVEQMLTLGYFFEAETALDDWVSDT